MCACMSSFWKVPRATPILYQLDGKSMLPIKSSHSATPLTGRLVLGKEAQRSVDMEVDGSSRGVDGCHLTKDGITEISMDAEAGFR